MPEAARWIGSFQRRAARLYGADPPSFITRYGRDYYAGWANRTMRRVWKGSSSWVPDACRLFLTFADDLASTPPTLIHGEYYPKNILWHDGFIYPVDWESVAFGVGLIDLVTLAEGWSAGDRDRFLEAYLVARWPEGVPAGTNRLLHVAEAYVQLRWLSEGEDLDRLEWRLKRLFQLSSILESL